MGWTAFDNLSFLHDDYFLRQMLSYADIMCNKENGQFSS